MRDKMRIGYRFNESFLTSMGMLKNINNIHSELLDCINKIQDNQDDLCGYIEFLTHPGMIEALGLNIDDLCVNLELISRMYFRLNKICLKYREDVDEFSDAVKVKT